MAASDYLIVEDGTGKPDANSYASLEDFIEYLTIYDMTAALGKTEEQQVAALLRACDYVETFNYLGMKTHETQSLAFPRKNCVPSGERFPIDHESVPGKIKRAQMTAAGITLTSGTVLQPTLTPSAYVIKKKVDVLETEYADPTKLGFLSPVLQSVDSLLAAFVSGSTGIYSIRTMRV